MTVLAVDLHCTNTDQVWNTFDPKWESEMCENFIGVALTIGELYNEFLK